MKIVLPIHQQQGGIGTLVRGLAANLPDALPPQAFLVLASTRTRRSSRVSRLWFEQFQLARLRDDCLLHLPDHRPVLRGSTPFTLTVHDVFFLDHPEWFPRHVALYKRRMLAAAISKGPRRIICVSEYARHRLLAHHPSVEQTAVVIHSGITPPPDVRVAPRSDGAPYFVTLSTLEPRKNHLTVLRALEDCRARGLGVRWKVVGREGYSSRPIRARLEASEGVDVLGELPAGDVERVLSGALFVAVPSIAEGFGFPALEAMVRGLPVCCSTGTGLDEAVAEAALRVDPIDVHGWSAAIERLTEDAATRERLIQRGKPRAETFTWSAAANRYAEVLTHAA